MKKKNECLPLGLVRAHDVHMFFWFASKGCVNSILGEIRKHNPRGDAETSSLGMLRKPGDLPYPCPRPKQFKRHATRDKPHGSRPNLRQRDPNGRIVPTPLNVLDEGPSTKRRVRKEKKNDHYTYTQRSPPGSAKGSGARTKSKHPTSDGLWANKMYLVVVKTTFLSAAPEAECGEAPSRGRFALSLSWWRTVKKW